MRDPNNPCIFCEIIAGRQPGSFVYEDADVVAVMDLRQENPGHVLVLPRRHLPDVYALDGEIAGKLFAVTARLAQAVNEAFQPDGLNIWQSNGEPAGQEIFHFHFHIFARRTNDRMFHVYSTPPGASRREELDLLAESIRARLDGDA